MTADAFRTALVKGQGRAALAAEERSPAHAEAIVDACLHDRRFEPASFKSQVPYLHYIVGQAGLERTVADAILHALPDTPAGRDRDGMVDLLGLFARIGDARAFEALLPLASTGDHRAQDGLAASGDPGLEWCVEHILPRYAPEDQGFVWKWLINGKWDDRTPTRKRLRMIREESMARARREGPSDKLTASLTGKAEFEEAHFGPQWIDADTLLDVGDEARLRDFVARAPRMKPRHDVRNPPPLPEGSVRTESACLVLAHLDSPGARTLALELLQRVPLVPRAPIALCNSGLPEDIPLVLAFLQRALSEPERILNAAAKDAEALARSKWHRAWQDLPRWAYKHAPSAEVRGAAFDWIVRVGRARRGLLREALYDVDAYTRNLAAERSHRPEAPYLSLAAGS